MRRTQGPDRPPTIPPASGSDKPSATPVGLDTKDPEVQLSVLRWMMSKRVGEVRIFAGRWVRRPGPAHVPDWAKNLTKVNPEAFPWARYSVDELNQQAKLLGCPPRLLDAPDLVLDTPRPTGDVRAQLHPAAPALGLQGPRQRGPKNKAQNQTCLAGWETLKEDTRCFLKEEGLPFAQTGPEWRLPSSMPLPQRGRNPPTSPDALPASWVRKESSEDQLDQFAFD